MSMRFDSLLKAGTYFAGIATIVGLLAIPVFADTTSTTTTSTTTSMSPSGAPMIDFSVLINPPMSHFDILRAHDFGLNTEQIGRVAAIAHWTGANPGDIINKIENGETFNLLAVEYGVNLNKLMSQTKYTNWVRNYREAYQHIGVNSLKHPDMNVYSTETTTTTTEDNDSD